MGSLRSRPGGGMAGTSSSRGALASDTVVLTVFLDELVRLANRPTDITGGRLPVTPEEEAREYDLGHDVEDAVEDGLRVRMDDVAALAQTPADRVQEPEQQQPDAAYPEGLLRVAAQHVGVAPRIVQELVRDEEERGHAEGPEAPFVPRLGKGADEPAHDHEQVGEEGYQYGGSGDPGSEEQLEQ